MKDIMKMVIFISILCLIILGVIIILSDLCPTREFNPFSYIA